MPSLARTWTRALAGLWYGYAWVLVASSVLNAAARAQTAGELAADAATREQSEQRRAEERERSQRRDLQRSPDVFGPAAQDDASRLHAWPAQETPCFVIQRIVLVFSGVHAQESAEDDFGWVLSELRRSADGVIGRCLGVQGLGVAAARAQQKLIERGYVTSRILLPPQDLSGGTLTLGLLPGRISAIRFAEPASSRATWYSTVPARAGDILNLRDIEQALENFRRIPSVQADIQIVPGAQPGQSELLIRWQQAIPVRLSVEFDDGGTKATGRYQGNATFSLDNWWTLNDSFYVTFGRDLGGGETGARGTRNSSVHYSFPVGYWELSLNTSSYSYYQTVAGTTQDYIYSGRGAQQDGMISRVVYRNATSKTTLGLGGFARQSRNYIDDTEVEVQRRRTGGWALQAGNRTQTRYGQVDAQLNYKRGTEDFGSMPAPEEAYGEGTSQFELTSTEIGWSLPFAVSNLPLNVSSRWHGQREFTPLTPQDRLAIGGRYSVRGFDGESSLAGDRGWWWRNELGAFWGGQQLYAGVDRGCVSGPSAERLVGRCLTGGVLGLRGQFSHGVSYDVFAGQPLQKPERFQTADTVAGFQMTMGF